MATSIRDLRGQLLGVLIHQIQRLDHFERVVGLLLGVLLRNLLRDLLRDFLLVPERVLVDKHRKSLVAPRFNEPTPLPCKVSNKVCESCCRVVVVCGAFGLLPGIGVPWVLTGTHRCALKVKRQPFCGWCRLEVMWSWTWSERCVVVNILSDVGT